MQLTRMSAAPRRPAPSTNPATWMLDVTSPTIEASNKIDYADQ